jgi:hypothetical protein
MLWMQMQIRHGSMLIFFSLFFSSFPFVMTEMLEYDIVNQMSACRVPRPADTAVEESANAIRQLKSKHGQNSSPKTWLDGKANH